MLSSFPEAPLENFLSMSEQQGQAVTLQTMQCANPHDGFRANFCIVEPKKNRRNSCNDGEFGYGLLVNVKPLDVKRIIMNLEKTNVNELIPKMI